MTPFDPEPISFQKDAFEKWFKPARDAYDNNEICQALLLIERYLQFVPTARWGQLLYGEILTDLRRFEEAEIALKKVRGKLKSGARFHLNHAWSQFFDKQGKLAEAEEWYRKLTEMEPKSTVPWILLGACLARQGKLEEAEEVHRKASGLEGDPDEAFLNLGLVLRAQGKFAEAAQAFQEALNRTYDYEEAQDALADALAAIELQKTAQQTLN